MAAKTTRLYFNTGFNVSNVPDRPSLLNSCQYTDLVGHWDYQDYFLTSLRVAATWDNVKNADYLKYGNGYYFVTGVEMINENTAKISLQLDALTTMGGPLALEYEGGLTERGWRSGVDYWTNNHTIEGISPVAPIEIEKLETIGADTTKSQTIVLSTLALSTQLNSDGTPVNASATEYKVPIVGSTIGSVIVPNSPVGARSTVISQGNQATSTDTGIGYYEYTQNVKDQIAYLRSLGLEQAICGCYTVPETYLHTDNVDTTGHIGNIYVKNGTAVDITNSAHGNYHRDPSSLSHLKKSYQMYTKYYAVSNITGEIKEYDPHDMISSGSVQIGFNWIADGNIKGMPLLYPTYYRGIHNQLSNGSLLDALPGASWLELPITISGASGSLWTKNDYVRNQHEIGLDTIKHGYDSITGVLKKITVGSLGEGYVQEYEGQMTKDMPSYNTYGQNIGSGFIGSVVDTVYNSAKLTYKADKMDADFAKSQIAVPSISGSSAYGLQLSLPNNWTIYRSYLSNLDLTRFDQYFNTYGYTLNEVFDKAIMNNRTDQNYVKVTDVHIKPTSASDYGIGIKQSAEAQLNNGVRIWHRLPSTGIDMIFEA